MVSLSRERIKDQMVQTAARAWGIEESEIEQNFDPLVMLLFEACAAEMEKIGNDISDSHSRLIDYLAEIILPETLLGAQPSIGILQAQPLEKIVQIDGNTQFQVSQKIKRESTVSPENVDFNLSPVGKFSLLNLSLAYFIAGQKITRVTDSVRETLFNAQSDQQSNILWLALNADKLLDDLNGLHIYFDLHNHSGSAAFYKSLSYAKASIHQSEVTLAAGLSSQVTDPFQLQQLFSSRQDRLNKIHKQAAMGYAKHFVHVSSATPFTAGVPPELSQQFSEEVLKKIQGDKLVFIKIELPQYFNRELLDAVQCSVNAFVVVNKKLHSMYYKTDNWLNIIPLQLEGYFVDLIGIKNEAGVPYKIKLSDETGAVVAGEAVIRASGVGKASSRTVREMINNITETIRDQSAYFSQISNEYILERLKEIGKMIAGLEDNMVAATDNKEDYHYLMLRPQKNGERLLIEYATTAGADANSIRAGIQVSAPGYTGINPKTAFTVTAFSGGKNQVTDAEKKSILKRQLLSGGKIISVEDVKLLCRQLFGNRLVNVNVCKAVSISAHPLEGFNRTIDVTLQLKNISNETQNETATLVKELEYLLAENASPIYPFRVIMQN